MVLAMSVETFAAIRIKCGPASDVVPEGATFADYQPFFSANRIIPKSELSLNFIEQFKAEFAKFPQSLHRELMAAGANIHIMEGEGVTVDPTWNVKDTDTFDGRSWSQVPGAGGSTAKEYSIAPTRVVINHLYDKQGSASMFLHEYAHNLDSINSYHGISSSQAWKDLLDSEPNALPFLRIVCGEYCANNIEEGFAEFMANYHGCEETRIQMEEEVPKIANFFRRFKSMKNLTAILKTDAEVFDEAPESEPETHVEEVLSSEPVVNESPRPREAGKPRLGCRVVLGRQICI